MNHFKEEPYTFPDQKTFLDKLLKDHQMIIESLRKTIDVQDKDTRKAGTAHFLSSLVQDHETTLGILCRYINRPLPGSPMTV